MSVSEILNIGSAAAGVTSVYSSGSGIRQSDDIHDLGFFHAGLDPKGPKNIKFLLWPL